jgi:monodechloroaminopyrrolnitrin synthase
MYLIRREEMASVKTESAYVVYKMGKLLDQSVSMLDPLDFDKYFVNDTFSKFATSNEIDSLLGFVSDAVGMITLENIKSLDEVSAMAAARDLNMVASAVTKFGVPMYEVPHLEELLLLLTEKTNEVPTDTVFGYGARNPAGSRQRSFTKTEEETLFIESFSDGMNGLVATLAGLETVQSMKIFDSRYASLVKESTQYLKEMQEAILRVRKHITPDFFTNRLRPFFDPKSLRGQTYFAAGGAQMPVTMIDLLLWGVEDPDRTYVGYRNENLRYLPRAFRSKVEVIMGRSSILESIRAQTSRLIPPSAIPAVICSIDSLQELADQLIRFRGPHLSVAKANMKIRAQGSVGSGGYDVMILQYLINKTKYFKSQLALARQAISEGSP